MSLPSSEACSAYLAETGHVWDEAAISGAYAAEQTAQANVCRVPAPDATEWPADLVEALYRRVAHNLALRALPLGVQASISEAAVATTRVGGTDAEVRRLEAPYRRVVVG